MVSSNGFTGQSEGTYFSAGAEVTVRDGEKGRPSDWYWVATRFLNDLPPEKLLGEEAAKRALRKIGQSKIETGQYTMLVENRAARRLFGMLRSPMTARALQQKRSYLDGMLGKKVASEQLTLVDDPFIPAGLGSRHFDGEGIIAKKRTMIKKGILKEYYIDDYYGKKLGMEPNSGTSSNIKFISGSKSPEQLIKDIKRGIYITGFIGGNSNSTTGDFSFGIVGQLIENGNISKAINEMNISGNSKDFWNKLVAVGNDPYVYSSIRMPSLLFENIQFSGA